MTSQRNRFWRQDNLVMTGIYAATSLAVVLPMLRPGFILTLDMVFTPHLPMPTSVNNGYLFYALLHVLNTLLPGDVLQKIVLFGIFLAAGMGMHRLVRTMDQASTGSRAQTLGYYVAGILYAINPFTYDRLMAGQYGALLGYALLPFFVRALLLLLRSPNVRQGVIVAVWGSVLAIVSIHTLGYMAVMALLACFWTGIRKRHGMSYVAKAWQPLLLALAGFCVLSSYWLVPLALGKGSTAHQLAQFSTQDSIAFATVGQNVVEKIGNVIRLQGFWQEDRYLYAAPQSVTRGWGLVGLVVWIIVICGFVRAYRTRHHYLVALFGSGILIGIVLACGVLQPLATHLSFLTGFREPQKFVALIALGYSFGMSFGVVAIVRAAERRARWLGYTAALLLLALPFVWTSVMLWGAKGQLTPRHYPDDWFTVNQLLNSDNTVFKTVFLPWHLYMYYDFSGRIIASPAPHFFDKPVLVSDDPEYNGAGAADTSATKQAVKRILDSATHSNLARELREEGVKYVLLAKQDDYYNYQYLSHTAGIKKIYEGQTLTVYQNTAYEETQ